MKKWIITILVAVAVVALGVTVHWWVPWLVSFAVRDKEKIEAFSKLAEAVSKIATPIVAIATFLYGLWQKKRDESKSGVIVTVDRAHAGHDVVAASGNVQTGGFTASGSGPVSFEGPVAARDVIIQQIAATPSSFNPLHQLPAPPRDFTGRDDELKELRTAIMAGGATISGQGGVGKTALVLKLAEELTPNFRDAQIYLNLLGMSERPLTPMEAMAYVVRAFHPEATLPEKEDELGATYRSALDGKRALLLMDNAKDAAQVRPLIPPAGCAMLVTSRTLHLARFSLEGPDYAFARKGGGIAA